MSSEMPEITHSNYGSNTSVYTNTTGAGWEITPQVADYEDVMVQDFCAPREARPRRMPMQIFSAEQLQHQPPQPQENSMSQRRIVQVFIADPNENVPLEKSVLHKGDQKLTDLNDQELFFEIPIREILEKHNVERVKTLDKDASRKAGKDIFLEAARIRDLKMLVVTAATF